MEDSEAGGADEPSEPGRYAARAGRRDLIAYGCMGLMVLIGSTTALSAKLAVGELPVPFVPLFRFGVAGLALLPWAMRGGALARLLRTDFRLAFLAGLLCIPLNQAFFLYGARLAPTTHVGLIYATCPLVVLITACMFGLERMRGDRLVGVLASVAGLMVLGLGNLSRSGVVGGGASSVLLGDSLLVGAVLTWGVYIIASKPLIARHGAIPSLAATFLIGSLLALIPSIVLLGLDPLALEQLTTASPRAWWSMAHLALVVSVVGLICQSVALRRVDASELATVGNAGPLLTVVWGRLFLGESITPYLLAGGVLTLGGILWTQRRRARVGAVSSVKRYPAAAAVSPRDDRAELLTGAGR